MNVIILIPVIRADNRHNYIHSYYKFLSYCGNEETVKKHKIKTHNSTYY
jgi:hypothetical protein